MKNRKTLATKKLTLLLLTVFLFSIPAHARDEDFGIFQFRKKLPDQHQLLFEYVRRDQGSLFSNKFLDLFRGSWGGQWGAWNYLVGATYVDFGTSTTEWRAHQFLIRPASFNKYLKGFVRAGLEERYFDEDDDVYFRGRLRGQLHLLTGTHFGFSFYDEIFYVPSGGTRFSAGVNEERRGLGIRLEFRDLEIYLFNVSGFSKSLKGTKSFEWAQLQTVWTF